MEDYKILANSYRQLFNQTGRIEFFMMYRNIEKTKTTILLEENTDELTL